MTQKKNVWSKNMKLNPTEEQLIYFTLTSGDETMVLLSSKTHHHSSYAHGGPIRKAYNW